MSRPRYHHPRQPYKDILQDDIAYAQWLVDLVDRTLPDEKTRRAPGFNIHEWRKRQERLHEILGKVARPKPSFSPRADQEDRAGLIDRKTWLAARVAQDGCRH